MSTTRGRWAFSLILAYGVISVGVPTHRDRLVALSPYWNGDLSAIRFTADNVREMLKNPEVADAIVNTLRTSFLAAAIVLPLGFVAALALSGVVRAPRIVRSTLDFIFIAPLAVPRALLGIAVLFVFIKPPFSLYGSLLLFVIGYAFVILPFSLRSQYNSLIGVHHSLFEASQVCGASQLRMMAWASRCRLPGEAWQPLWPWRSSCYPTISPFRSCCGHRATRCWGRCSTRRACRAIVPEVAVLALIMTVITTVILLLTIRFGGKSGLESL